MRRIFKNKFKINSLSENFLNYSEKTLQPKINQNLDLGELKEATKQTQSVSEINYPLELFSRSFFKFRIFRNLFNWPDPEKNSEPEGKMEELKVKNIEGEFIPFTDIYKNKAVCFVLLRHFGK
jgi:hypothetical protein